MSGAVTTEAILEVVRPLVRSKTERERLTSTTPLLTSGLIDSLSVAELCDALSSAFDVDLDVADVATDNADTVVQLVDLVEQNR